MNIKILSDLHLDINRMLNLDNKDVFTIIAGDISTDIQQSKKWFKNNVKQGLFVEGNHLGYGNKSIEYLENELLKEFTIENDISFLTQGSYKIINDIVFVGATLWTDFNLYNTQTESLLNAKNIMNDYNYCCINISNLENEKGKNKKYLLKNKLIRKIDSNDILNFFIRDFNNIKNVVEKFKDKKVVVITHHCPSIKSIQEKYLLEKHTNQYFASNLDNFILDNKNIVCWIHGHTHSFNDYYIGNCRVVNNAFGYRYYNECINFNKNFCIEI